MRHPGDADGSSGWSPYATSDFIGRKRPVQTPSFGFHSQATPSSRPPRSPKRRLRHLLKGRERITSVNLLQNTRSTTPIKTPIPRHAPSCHVMPCHSTPRHAIPRYAPPSIGARRRSAGAARRACDAKPGATRATTHSTGAQPLGATEDATETQPPDATGGCNGSLSRDTTTRRREKHSGNAARGRATESSARGSSAARRKRKRKGKHSGLAQEPCASAVHSPRSSVFGQKTPCGFFGKRAPANSWRMVCAR